MYEVPMWLHVPIGIMITVWFIMFFIQIVSAMFNPKIRSITVTNRGMFLSFVFMLYWSWIIFGGK